MTPFRRPWTPGEAELAALVRRVAQLVRESEAEAMAARPRRPARRGPSARRPTRQPASRPPRAAAPRGRPAPRAATPGGRPAPRPRVQSGATAPPTTRPARRPRTPPPPSAPPAPPPSLAQGNLVPNLETIVQQAIGDVRQQSGRRWLPAHHFGTRLHAAVSRRIGQTTPPQGWTIASEQPLRALTTLPPGVADMTLGDYVRTQRPDLAGLTSDLPRDMLRTSVGSLQPDLVIRPPDGTTVVWDLTSRENPAHLAKTMLYANLLAQDNQLVRIGETHWRNIRRQPATTAGQP